MITYRLVQRTISIGGIFEMPELGPHWTVEFLIGKEQKVKPLGVFFLDRTEADCVGYNLCLSMCQRMTEHMDRLNNRNGAG